MPISGWTTTLPAEVALDAAVMYVGATVMGATKGPPKWDPGIEEHQLEVDGISTPIEGAERVISYRPKITGTLVQVASATAIGRLLPGNTSGAVTGGTAYTPRNARTYFTPVTDYLTDIRAVWELGDGESWFAIYLPKARITIHSIESVEKDVTLIPFTIEGRLAAAADPNSAPFKYETRTALPV